MIRLSRLDFFHSHGYQIDFPNVTVHLSPEELCSIVRQAWDYERPLTDEEYARFMELFNK